MLGLTSNQVMKSNRLAIAFVVALAALSACGGGPGPGPTPGPTSVTLRNLVYTRILINNPDQASKPPLFWTFETGNGSGGTIDVECSGLQWSPVDGGGVGSTWTCPQMTDMPIGATIKMWISDSARATVGGSTGTAIVCSDVTINGTKLRTTSESPREFCYFKVDASGGINQ